MTLEVSGLEFLILYLVYMMLRAGIVLDLNVESGRRWFNVNQQKTNEW